MAKYTVHKVTNGENEVCGWAVLKDLKEKVAQFTFSPEACAHADKLEAEEVRAAMEAELREVTGDETATVTQKADAELVDVDALFANAPAEYTCKGTEDEGLAGNCPGCTNCKPPATAHERFVARKAYVDGICTRMHCTKDAAGAWVFQNDVYEHMFGQLMGWYDQKWSALAELYEVAVMYATNPTECSLTQYANAMAVIAFVEAEEYEKALAVGLVY